ncbi:helix-turn-helix domain-containing protein [Desulfosporosinus fructosivorans]
MEIVSDEELVAAFGMATIAESITAIDAPSVEPIVEPIVEQAAKDLAPKETYWEWAAKREISARQEYAAIPTITPEVIVKAAIVEAPPIVEEVIVEEAVEAEVEVPIVEVEEVAPTKASKGKSKEGLFIKAGIGMLQGTLVKDLGASCFTTLMALSAYMNNKGECFPSQETLAGTLGINRQAVSKHINKLLKYRTQDGLPIIEARKVKVDGMPYARLFYVILPASGLSFG